MAKTSTQNYIRISKKEYTRLKNLQKRFEVFWNYFEHLKDIKDARKDIASKRIISQEKLFKKLGI